MAGRPLRPDYQIPRFGKDLPAATGDLTLDEDGPRRSARGDEKRAAASWPGSAAEQILAVKGALAGSPRSAEQVVTWFTSARADLVARHLDTLALLGEARKLADGRSAAAVKRWARCGCVRRNQRCTKVRRSVAI